MVQQNLEIGKNLLINNITILVNVNPGIPINTLINCSASVLPVIGDVNPLCNQTY